MRIVVLFPFVLLESPVVNETALRQIVRVEFRVTMFFQPRVGTELLPAEITAQFGLAVRHFHVFADARGHHVLVGTLRALDHRLRFHSLVPEHVDFHFRLVLDPFAAFGAGAAFLVMKVFHVGR